MYGLQIGFRDFKIKKGIGGSDPIEVYTGGVTFFIKGFTLESYQNVMWFSSLWKGYRNTIFYTAVGTAYNMLLLLPASYALSRRELKGRGFFMAYFVFTMYFGDGMIPSYLNIRDLNLLDIHQGRHGRLWEGIKNRSLPHQRVPRVTEIS